MSMDAEQGREKRHGVYPGSPEMAGLWKDNGRHSFQGDGVTLKSEGVFLRDLPWHTGRRRKEMVGETLVNLIRFEEEQRFGCMKEGLSLKITVPCQSGGAGGPDISKYSSCQAYTSPHNPHQILQKLSADNRCKKSELLLTGMTEKEQLCPPHKNRRKTSERGNNSFQQEKNTQKDGVGMHNICDQMLLHKFKKQQQHCNFIEVPRKVSNVET